jgi:hypothetical protein
VIDEYLVMSSRSKMVTPPGTVQLCRDERLLIGLVTAFINAAFELYDTVVVIVTQKHRKDLYKTLTIEKLANEKLMLLDAEGLLSEFMVEDWPNESRFMETMETILRPSCVTGKVRVINELAGVLCAEGKASAAIRVEELWKILVTRHRCSAVGISAVCIV